MGDSEHNRNPGRHLRIYSKLILGFPLTVLVLVGALAAFFFYNVQNFKLDASSDSIVLENDSDLRYYDQTRELFGSDDYIIVTVTPEDGELISDKQLARMGEMSDEFEAMDSVESITSILNVPLFHSPDVPLVELADGYRTLEVDADRELALEDLITSPLYSNYLISTDGKTTAIQLTFNDNPDKFKVAEKRRIELRDKRRDEGLTADEKIELARVEIEYADMYEALILDNTQSIDKVREIVPRYADLGELHIGGVPMIMADIIAYVEDDIFTFTIAVTFVVLLVLTVIFRSLQWIILPTAVCVLTVVFMIGYMGFSRWNGTIITSNFPSLLFVIALADVLHVAVHYRELYARYPDWSKRDLVLKASREVAVPCLYTSMTTIVGFGSLIVSGIRPVMDFGIIMASGVAIAYLLCFVFLPAGLMLFPKGKVPPASLAELNNSPLKPFATFTDRHRYTILIGAVLLVATCAVGVTRLKVENRFIDYFHTDTEIYQGMSVIDERLGGTTPLEIVLEANAEKLTEDELKNFWLQEDNRVKLKEVHEWFESLPQSGKVISPQTMERMITKVNGGNHVPSVMIQFALAGIPPEIQDAVVGPYMTPDRTKVRLSTRAKESDESLSRKDLMAAIHEYFETAEIFQDGTIEPHVTGVFVLYNNMLQSLFDSQIKTVGAVFGLVWVMFLILFRSFRIATIGILPNVLPIMLVLGTLGWSGKPLDLMTIMTAAITLGIAVDFAIHYIHRFKLEFKEFGSYTDAMNRTNNSIGRAMFYTTITIIIGFSILVFSNFIPSIYFGIFTSLAIVVAFIAAVTLLPLLMILLKPLGPEFAVGAVRDAEQEAA